MVRLLFQHGGSKRTSETVVTTALANETAVLGLIKYFSQKNSFKVTEGVVKAAAANKSCGQQLIEHLIATRPADVQARGRAEGSRCK